MTDTSKLAAEAAAISDKSPAIKMFARDAAANLVDLAGRVAALEHAAPPPVPPTPPTNPALLALDYASGAIVKPTGKWDAIEQSGSGAGTGANVVNGQGVYTMTPGSQTQGGWHVRALSRVDRGSFAVNPGTRAVYGFTVRFPSAQNSDNLTAGRMVTEFIHNANGVVNSMIAPLGIFIHEPQEAWDGTQFVPVTSSAPALVLRVCGGYVPNQQPGGSHPATNQSDWHPNIRLLSPVPTDTNIHLIVEVLYHEGAGANPVGGGNVHSAPMFTGADTQLGSVRVSAAVTNATPLAADFHELISLPAVRTLVYGDNGSGAVVHDQPYGPFAGLYDSADTIGYTAQSIYATFGVYASYADALAALT